jgi:predicted GNAT family acetyltransferase
MAFSPEEACQIPVRHERSGHKGAFVMERDGKRVAEMTYTVAGSRVIIDHTTVDDALRGTGAGGKLVEAAVQWARAEKVKLLPLCPFAKSVFDKTPQYADVLAD